MTDPGRAVFLSYASQDAPAAEQLCNALGNAGIEVWFDRRELRGGDAWDALIRRQIKGCYLFVPIISANTQSREEGYFRREWKLAVDRTNDMAEDRAFLLPIVIDATSDLDARVPEKFREVQWTRLSVDKNASAFVDHVRCLLSLETTLSASPTSHSPAPPVASPRVGSAAALIRGVIPKFRSFIIWLVAGLVVLAGGYVVSERFLMHRPAVNASDTPAVPANEKSLAVLPFADMSEKKDQEYFSDGLAEELIDQLGKTPGLKVIARTSSFSFKGKSDDIPTIAAKLKVANVLEGSVRRSGDHLRVSTQLVRADSAEQLWSETYDRDFKDVFTVQDDIATAVVAALKLKLVGGSTTDAVHGTANTEAYAAYLLGQQLYRQSTPASNLRAIDSYHRAISLDPRYAQAYAELARAQYRLGDIEADASLKHAAQESAQKAIDLDARLGLGYAMRSLLRSANFDWTGAEADARQALTLNPTDPSVLTNYARLCYRLGRLPEAVSMYRKALERDPLAHVGWQGLGFALAALHDYSAAYDAFGRALAANAGSMYNKFGLASLLLRDGNALEALSTYQTIDFEPFRDTGVAMAEHTLGDAKASQAALDALIGSSAGIDAYPIAQVYAWRGDKDRAFEWLERAYRQQDGGLLDIKIDPFVTSLHSDPRYAALLKNLNFPQ